MRIQWDFLSMKGKWSVQDVNIHLVLQTVAGLYTISILYSRGSAITTTTNATI